MNWTFIFIMGFLFGLAFVWPISKLDVNVKRVINRHAFAVDILVGAIMSYLFIGTQGGMIIATIATLVFTGYLAYSIYAIGSGTIRQALYWHKHGM